MREYLKLFRRPARKKTYSVFLKVIPHFNSRSIANYWINWVSQKQKALSNQFDLIWWRWSFLIGWDLLYCSFSIYLRYHPDGLGGSVNHCIVNLSILLTFQHFIHIQSSPLLQYKFPIVNPWIPLKPSPNLRSGVIYFYFLLLSFFGSRGKKITPDTFI